mmetsp:Transcript_25754/g.84842  ORF Transcript_25754/g.84842 Transcript_25754/m.84842 type:complete len:237 (+) Transcript_25754:42-752(+)
MWPQTEEGRTHRNEGVEQEAGEQGPPPPLAVRGAASAHTPTVPITPRCTQLVSPLLPAQRGQLLRVPARGRRHLRARRQPQRAQRPQRRVVTRRTYTVPVSPSEEHRRLVQPRVVRVGGVETREQAGRLYGELRAARVPRQHVAPRQPTRPGGAVGGGGRGCAGGGRSRRDSGGRSAGKVAEGNNDIVELVRRPDDVGVVRQKRLREPEPPRQLAHADAGSCRRALRQGTRAASVR